MGDYIMRQIQDMTRVLATVIFMRRLDAFDIMDEEGNFTAGYVLGARIRALLAKGRVNEAENLLFEMVEQNAQPAYLPVALDFYERLGRYSDEELAAADFSRAEVAEGLAALLRAYNEPMQDAQE